MHERANWLLISRRRTRRTLGLLGLWVCCVHFTQAQAHVYAFRDPSGHLSWTNAPGSDSGLSLPVLVLKEPTNAQERENTSPPTYRFLPDAKTHAVMPLVTKAAARYKLDPAVLMALIEVESSFKTTAISSKGARGLMQLMPATAKRYGLRNSLDLHDPATNIELGARHLRDLLNAHQGNLAMALASYNAGQPAVRRHGGAIPAFRETMLYVPAVLARVLAYRSLVPPESSHAF